MKSCVDSMNERPLPDWLVTEDSRDLPRDRDAFLWKSARMFAFVVRSARYCPDKKGRFRLAPAVKLSLAFACVFCVSAARNFAFVEIVGVALLLLFASFESRKLRRVIVPPLEAFLASVLILAPSLFWGQTRAFFVIPIKTLITTGVLSVLAQSMGWNRFSCAFRSFGVPDSLVFIFDLTLKYTVIFSEVCLSTIDAVILRSVGRNRSKARSLGGIVGLVFFRAQDAAQDQFDAMKCRCFSGVYRRYSSRFTARDYLAIALIVALLGTFVYLESLVNV